MATVTSDFATLNVGSISYHTFKMDALYWVKSRGLVKRTFGTLLKKAVCNKHKVKPEVYINTTCAC